MGKTNQKRRAVGTFRVVWRFRVRWSAIEKDLSRKRGRFIEASSRVEATVCGLPYIFSMACKDTSIFLLLLFLANKRKMMVADSRSRAFLSSSCCCCFLSFIFSSGVELFRLFCCCCVMPNRLQQSSTDRSASHF